MRNLNIVEYKLYEVKGKKCMLDDLCELTMSENGFIVNIREYNQFDIKAYKKIIYILRFLVDKYKTSDFVPKKFALVAIELVQHLVRGNNFMNEEQHLDQSEVFGSSEKRADIIINAEIMPPEPSNAQRAIRLNPSGRLLNEWLEECAEEEETDDDEEDEAMYDVILIKPVLDKKETLKIKRAFFLDCGAVQFIELAANPPFTLKSKIKYTEVQSLLSKYPKLKRFLTN